MTQCDYTEMQISAKISIDSSEMRVSAFDMYLTYVICLGV